MSTLGVARALPFHASAHRADTVRRASFGLISSGYLALAVSAAMNPLMVPVAALFVGMAYWLRVNADAAAEARQRWLRRLSALGFACGALFALLEPSTLSLVAAAVIWGGFRVMFSPESERNYYVSFLVALAQLVVSGGTTDSVVFAGSIMLFIVAGTLALAAMTLRGQRGGISARFGERPAREGDHSVPVIQNGAWEAEARLLFRLATIVTGVIIASTIVLFFVIPRYGAGYFFSKEQQTERRAAFSDTVDFGAVGAVQRGGAVALRVELPHHKGPFPGVLRWRGVGLGFFDGRRWSATEGRESVLHDVVKGFREASHLVHGPFYQGSKRLEQKIFLTQDNGMLFGATRIHRVWAKLTRLVRTTEDTLLVKFPAYTSRNYRCISDVGRPPVSRLRGTQGMPMSATLREIYTQLPASLDPRVKQLAQTITGDAANDHDRAFRLERWLTTQFKYQLPVSTTKAPEHPVEEFLFRTRKGHCEYFAAALAVMLRTQGVPARVVNGYAGGTWSQVGGYYLVSDADAHSWVEVFFPSLGWIDFDATPPDALGRPSQDMFSSAFMYWDALVMAWRRYVVDYHLLDQVEYARGLGRWITGNTSAAPSTTGSTPGRALPPLVAFVILAAAVLVMLMRVLVRQASASVLELALGDASFYLRFLELLTRRGFPRRDGHTPLEHARAVSQAWPEAAGAVEGVTAAYHRVRFGAHPASTEAAQVASWLETLEKTPAARS